jgi:hypothetical protein
MASELTAVYVIPMANIYNVEIFGVKDAEPVPPQALIEKTRERIQKGELKDPLLLMRLGQIVTQPIVTNNVPLLTDDYAPVETLGFRWGKK